MVYCAGLSVCFLFLVYPAPDRAKKRGDEDEDEDEEESEGRRVLVRESWVRKSCGSSRVFVGWATLQDTNNAMQMQDAEADVASVQSVSQAKGAERDSQVGRVLSVESVESREQWAVVGKRALCKVSVSVLGVRLCLGSHSSVITITIVRANSSNGW
jgi:hypothetical protein